MLTQYKLGFKLNTIFLYAEFGGKKEWILDWVLDTLNIQVMILSNTVLYYTKSKLLYEKKKYTLHTSVYGTSIYILFVSQ